MNFRSALSADDLAKAQFQVAIGQDVSPDFSAPHLLAEFQLSIDNTAPGRSGGTGSLDDPVLAFWSASVGGADDPSISSAISNLTPTGPTGVTPVLGPNGGPLPLPLTARTPSCGHTSANARGRYSIAHD